MEFKENDTVIFKKPVKSYDTKKVAGLGTMGHVTVVGVEMPDGSTNGIEVLCPGEGYFHCYPRELDVLGHKDDARDLSHLIEDRPHMKKDRNFNPMAEAVGLVNAGFYNGELPVEDVYVVWFCSTIQNWKALVSTNVKDNAYYEVTHNGEKNETYVDKYLKYEQMVVDRTTDEATVHKTFAF